ncbi:hypothetical protein FSP39_023706 [Pinctada imbricata]|uniref:ABC-type glutathione-S-conjugate transporter n=1 Tax=Pinctada imbricata TaxID=66713 RepID=A0AA89BQR8_PINIB|nr:hypothetical protein FSP39_023706 [Pinctada imbricata]
MKTVVSGWVAVITIAEIAKSIQELVNEQTVKTVDFVSPLVLCVTMMLSILVVHHERRRGVYSSGFQFCFWLLLSTCAILIFQSKVREAVSDDGISDVFRFVTFHLYFPAILVQFVLCWFSDKVEEFEQVTSEDPPCPEGQATFLSRITFWWFTSLVVQGYKKALERKDLWQLNQDDASATVVPHFDKCWQKQVQKSRKIQQSSSETPATDGIEIRSMNKDGTTYTEVNVVDGKKCQPAKLLNALVSAYSPMCLMTAFYKLIFDVFQFLSPLILKLLIQFTYDKSEFLWRGYFYAILMLVVAILQSFILHQYFHGCFLLGMRIRTALISAIYRKMLNLSNTARKNATVGEIVNLMSVDAQRFMDLMTYIHTIWSGPLQIIIALYFLWRELGASIFAGFAVMVILIPINALIAKKTRDLQVKQMNMKDKRIKLMNEVLNGIKVLKLYAWELSFEEKILAIRNKELRVLRTMAILNAVVSFTWTTAPFVTTVSLKRLQAFLNNEELDPNCVQRDLNSKHSITVDKASFTWEKDAEKTLSNISLEIPEGSLVAVVGSVGSGKSSLLSAILGEMEKLKGSVNVKGSVAYVAQQAWIQNATLQDNVLFGKPLSKEEYAKVIEGCALTQDLEILPGGDQTEIGEKGINLSGGQKQRVSLARAVYQDADIYLFDDPLSAVDSHVGKHIFDHVISSEGILKNKTRVLVTHGVSFLPKVDLIVTLVNGEISEVGTFQELMTHAGAFAEFLKNYLVNELENEENLEADLNDIEDLKRAEDLVSQLGSIMEDEGTKSLQKQVSKLSRMRTMSQTDSREDIRPRTNSELSAHCKPLTSSHSSLAKSGDIPQSPSSPGTKRPALKRQQSEFCHPSEKIKEKEAVIKQVEEKKKEDKLIQAEKVETGKVKMNVFYAYLKSIGLVLSIVIILFYILYNVSSVYSNIWLSEWSTDKPILKNGTNGTMIQVIDTDQRDLRLGVYGALGFIQGAFMMIANVIMVSGMQKASRNLHFSMLLNILRSPMSFFDTTPSGRLMNRFSKDIMAIDMIISENFKMMLMCLLMVASTIIVISMGTPLFLTAIIPLTILYIVVQRFYVATSRQLKRLESISRSPIYSHFGETITGVSTIRAYQQQERFNEESEQKVDENNICYYPSIVANRWLAIRLEFVGNCIVFFACLFAVIGRESLTAGIVGLSITYALNVTQTLNWLVRMTTELETNIVAVERVKEYSETPTEAAWVLEDNKPSDSWPDSGRVEFKDYGVRYREGLDLVLKGISCKINPGEKIGIVGRTGAGKSSLTLALFRIIERAKGSIVVDGIDIASIGLHSLRSKLTIIPQEPVLFSGSLRMNLDPFDYYSDDAIWQALEHAHLKNFVSSLPDKLQHECTEGGENLSVGQRQLVCLARALLRKTKILILDEATAAVDLETDDLIQHTIRTEFADCTILTIAHRLNTIMDYTKIMVLSAGEIHEFDSPQNLLQDDNGIFYGMAKDANLV